MSKVSKNLRRLLALCMAFLMFLSGWMPVGVVNVRAGSNPVVLFSYPNFFPFMQVDLSESVVFAIGVHVPPSEDMPLGGSFEWLRNGIGWTGTGGTGSFDFDEWGSAEVQLVLPEGMTHFERGGSWRLRVDVGGTWMHSRDATLNVVDGRMFWTPEPLPTPTGPPPPPFPTPTPTPVYVPTPLYPTFGNLDRVNDTATAVAAVRQAFLASTPEDLALGLLDLFAETAIKHSASQDVVSPFITLDNVSLARLATTARITRSRIEDLFETLGYKPQRDLRTSVAFRMTSGESHVINIDPSAAAVVVDLIWVQSPRMDIGITRDFMLNNTQTPLTIQFSSQMERLFPHAPKLLLMPDPAESIGLPVVTPPPLRPPVGPNPPLWRSGLSAGINPVLPYIEDRTIEMRTYWVHFSRHVADPIRLSVAPIEGTRAFQVVRDIHTGAIHNARNNRVTGNLDARVRTNGVFTVFDNEVNFVDTFGLSLEKQMAIQILASQGILHGFSRFEFRPDEPITRAQYASAISRMLGLYDTNASSGFVDVSRSDWHYGAVGSVLRAGLMEGTDPGRYFSPDLNLPNQELALINTRMLRREMGYQVIESPRDLLRQHYLDWLAIPFWSAEAAAFVTYHNLFVPPGDNRFGAYSTLSRDELALVLYRTYMRLW